MTESALNYLNQTFDSYVKKPTHQGQETLMIAAVDYREEWIEAMAGEQATATPSTKPKSLSTRYKKIMQVLGVQPDGTELTLSLQTRTKSKEGVRFKVVSWRTRLAPGGKNRRFYVSNDAAWKLNANVALKMLEDLNIKGGLDEEHYDLKRRPNFDVTISDELSDAESDALYDEITMPDEDWGQRPLLVVLDQNEDSWRKILIVNRNTGVATFRSTTKKEDYMPRKVLREGSEWYLDNSMQDANVQQSIIFLEQLRKIVPSLQMTSED
jgi:hypothetical protein